jgi:hypothetical protein
MFTVTSKSLAVVASTSILALSLMVAGAAAQTPAPPSDDAAEQNLEQMRLQQIQQELATIQQTAFAENPQLQSLNDDLEELVTTTMQDLGYDPDGIVESLEAAQEKLEAGDLSEMERQVVIQEAQAAQQQFQAGQQAALQDSQVVAAQETLRDELLDAMREQEPATDALITEFEELQQAMIRSMQPPAGDDGF